MLAHSLRASRQTLARAIRPQHAATLRRTLITPTAVRQADQVQDMYLNALKNYKPTPIKEGDEKGQVKEYHAPKAPTSPEEADLANELKDYESQQVEVEGQSSGGESSEPVQDWFEEPEEDEEDEAH